MGRDYVTEDKNNGNVLQIKFWSPTDLGIRDSPRAWRNWKGTLNVQGATVKKVSAPPLKNPRSEYDRLDENNPNLIHFETMTRGSEKTIFIEVDQICADTLVEVALVANVERYSTPARYRRAARLPAAKFQFKARDSWEGRAEHAMQVDLHIDQVTMKIVNLETSLDQSFEFTDDIEPERGDYYYLRVRQMDGGMAWSSPIWVGGAFTK